MFQLGASFKQFLGGMLVPAAPSHRASTGERINTAETTGKLHQSPGRARFAHDQAAPRHSAGHGRRGAAPGRGSDFARAQKIDPGVHLVTVYRTIDLLKKQGLIDELDLLHLRGDRHYYESHGPRDHIHVACLRCGKVREFESRLYEQLKEQIARDFNMKVTISRTEVGGYCAECLAANPALGGGSCAPTDLKKATALQHVTRGSRLANAPSALVSLAPVPNSSKPILRQS